MTRRLSRRRFIKNSGSLVVFLGLPAGSGLALAQSAASGNAELDRWIGIGADGWVRLSVGKVELGQGIKTALAQIAAEELDVDLARVEMPGVDTDVSPDESYTFSSISITQSGTAVRKAAAYARQLLLGMAAERLGVPADSLQVNDGQITQPDGGPGTDYWELLGGHSFTATIPDTVTVKPTNRYQLVGRSAQRKDIPAKVFGQAVFLQDQRLNGMVHARVVRPPNPAATIATLDSSAVEALPGVLKVVRDGNFLAVVAEWESQAVQAAKALAGSVEWTLPANLPDQHNLSAWLRSAPADDYEVHERGAEPHAAPEYRAKFSKPFHAHASISPSAAVAVLSHGYLDVLSHAQGMYPLRGAIAHLVGMDEEKVRCMHFEASGCYGHNGADDAAADAAMIAMQVPDRPVRLQWSRADEFQWEPYGPAMEVEIGAQLGDDGLVSDWRFDVWSCTHSTRPRGGPGAGNLAAARQKANAIEPPPPRAIPQPAGGADRNAVPLYSFPNVRVRKHLVTEMPLRTSALRGLGAYANVFAIESCMDELAMATGQDCFEFRMRQLQDPRAVELLESLRELSEWSKRPAVGIGKGWGLGFARFKNLGAYLGVVMQLEADPRSGEIHLNKAYAVLDAGLTVNPDGARAQIEGSIIQSASWTLMEQVQFSSNRIETRDWANYPILKFSEVPDIEVRIIDRPDQPPLGLGEAAQGPTAAAIANAVAHATSRRIRDLPLLPERVKTGT